jgi:hypothetical protein
VQGFDAGLQQQMRLAFAPWPLLFFAQPLTPHLMPRRLYAPGGHRLAVLIPLAVLGDQVAIVPNIRAECFHGFGQRLAWWIRLFNVV